jgi:hypothetical protein
MCLCNLVGFRQTQLYYGFYKVGKKYTLSLNNLFLSLYFPVTCGAILQTPSWSCRSPLFMDLYFQF